VQRQLTLDLGTPPPSTFDNFHTAANAELVARLRGLDAALAAGPVADRTFYIWGEPGNGRSHLLHALVHEAPPGHARYLGPQSALAAFSFDPRVAIYAVDDCDALSGAQQIALFNLFNEVRSHPTSALVATGNAAPMGLAVREDLRTRLGWGLVFHLAPLSDEGKSAVLKRAARERGIALADDVPAYLLTHFRRDMPSLMALLDALDRFSLEQKRAVTLPLLRTMLAAGVPSPEDAAAPMGLGSEAGDSVSDAGDEFDFGDGGEPGLPDQAPPAPAGGAHEPVHDALPTEEAPAPYEPPRAPAAHARAPQPVPFATPTDNVDGELGAPFRDVVDRELGGALTGEVEADVSGEMNGELSGDLEAAPPGSTPAAAAPDAKAAGASAPDATTATNAAPPRPEDKNAPNAASDPAAAAQPHHPPPEAGTGNGMTRFK
jgi:DnaA regulatory inactivator Hda